MRIIPVARTVTTAVILAIATPAHATDAKLERGAYLVNGITACGHCHTPRGPDRETLPDQTLAGGVIFTTPSYRAVSPNITPDQETGIGTWTDAQIIDAIRNGRRPDGSLIGPPMPVRSYRALSDDDALAIVAYLRSVPPIRHQTERSTYKTALPETYGPQVTQVAATPESAGAQYGAYLASLGHCLECHTPLRDGRPDLTRTGAGGRTMSTPRTGTVVTANLTPANPDGIASWTDDQVKQAITTGQRPDGHHLARLMAFDWYKNLNPTDLDALVAYLRSLKPATP